MCVSAEVSATFALAEAAAIAALWRRGRGRDRLWVFAAAPITFQEALQCLLWLEIEGSGGACTPRNATLTLIVRQVVGLVPLGFVSLGVLGSGAQGERAGRLLLGLVGAYVFTRAAASFVGYALSERICTTVGPHHHQIWGDLLTIYGDLWIDELSLLFYTVLPLVAIARYLRPPLVAAAIVGGAGGSLAWILHARLEEHTSLWCWACSALLVVALLDPGPPEPR